MHFFLPALTLVFVAAKLFGAISWSWLWVFSPLLFGWGFMLLLFAVLGLAYMADKKR